MEKILHQLIGSFSHYLQGFTHPRWGRISSINSMKFRLNVENIFQSGLQFLSSSESKGATGQPHCLSHEVFPPRNKAQINRGGGNWGDM